MLPPRTFHLAYIFSCLILPPVIFSPILFLLHSATLLTSVNFLSKPTSTQLPWLLPVRDPAAKSSLDLSPTLPDSSKPKPLALPTTSCISSHASFMMSSMWGGLELVGPPEWMVTNSLQKILTICPFWLEFTPNLGNFVLIPVEMYVCFRFYP